MPGRGVTQVLESDCKTLPVGAIVQARLGWQEYALIDDSHRPAPFIPTRRPPPLSHGIGAVSFSWHHGVDWPARYRTCSHHGPYFGHQEPPEA